MPMSHPPSLSPPLQFGASLLCPLSLTSAARGRALPSMPSLPVFLGWAKLLSGSASHSSLLLTSSPCQVTSEARKPGRVAIEMQVPPGLSPALIFCVTYLAKRPSWCSPFVFQPQFCHGLTEKSSSCYSTSLSRQFYLFYFFH